MKKVTTRVLGFDLCTLRGGGKGSLKTSRVVKVPWKPLGGLGTQKTSQVAGTSKNTCRGDSGGT